MAHPWPTVESFFAGRMLMDTRAWPNTGGQETEELDLVDIMPANHENVFHPSTANTGDTGVAEYGTNFVCRLYHLHFFGGWSSGVVRDGTANHQFCVLHIYSRAKDAVAVRMHSIPIQGPPALVEYGTSGIGSNVVAGTNTRGIVVISGRYCKLRLEASGTAPSDFFFGAYLRAL